MRILNYLDDWLLLAQSQDQLCEHRDLVLSHLSQLGLRVNWEKSKLSPMQRISFLGMELDSVNQTARLTQEHAQSVLNCLNTFKSRMAVPLKQFQRLLWHMAAVVAVTPLGLLHMSFNTGSMAESRGGHGRAARCGSKSLQPGVKPSPRGQTFCFFGQECPWNRSPGMPVVYTDASAKDWGATFNGLAVSGVWTGPQLHWHINCLELLTVQETLTRRARTGLYRQHCDRRVHHPTRWSKLPLHVVTRPPPPPLESEASEVALRHSHSRLAQPDSRRAVTSCAPGEWRLYLQTVQLIWRHFGLAQVDLFTSLETSHCQLSYSLTEGTLGTDVLSAGPSQVCISPVSLLAQTLCKIREEEEQILHVAPYWPTRTWFPELMLLVTAPP